MVAIKIYPLRHGEYFHHSLLPFLFDSWLKRWEIAEEVSMDCTAYTYYVTLMAKCMYAWLHHLLKLLTSAMFFHVPIQVNQDDFMLRLTCMFLGCDLLIRLLLKSLSSTYDDNDRLVDRFDSHHKFLIHITNYETCNILCLNK